MSIHREVVAVVDEEVRDLVQAAYYKKMSTLDTINYLASNGGYGDNKEYMAALEAEKLNYFAEFSMKFEAMCAQFAPDMDPNILKLDFNSAELYYTMQVDSLR